MSVGVDVGEIGPVCADSYLDSICSECCAADTQFECLQPKDCADAHDHVGDRALCKTLTGIEGALDLAAFVLPEVN